MFAVVQPPVFAHVCDGIVGSGPAAVEVGFAMLMSMTPPVALFTRASAMFDDLATTSMTPCRPSSASARSVALEATVTSTFAPAIALTVVSPTEIVPPPLTSALAWAPLVRSVGRSDTGSCEAR